MVKVTPYKFIATQTWGCGCVNIHTDDTFLQTVDNSDYLKNRRKKPVPDPFLSPTSLGSKWRRFSQEGVQYRVTDSPRTCPTSGGGFYYCVNHAKTSSRVPVPTLSFKAVVDESAITRKIYDKLAEQLDSISGSVAEIDEVTGMIKDMVKATNLIIRCARMKRGSCKRLYDYVKTRKIADIPAAWLAYSFGIAPLSQDLYTICKRHAEKPLWKRIVSNWKTEKSYFEGNPLYLKSERIFCKTTLFVQLREPWVLPVGIGNPAEWMWERIPFSFVLDWTFDIGSAIAAVSNYRYVKCSKGVRSTKMEAYYTQESPSSLYTMALPGVMRYRSYRRDVIQSFPAPVLPTVGTSQSVIRLLNALSLLSVLRTTIHH